MCPTLLGRLQTRIVILVVPAFLAAVLSLITGNGEWLALLGLYLVMGAILDMAVYAPIVSWQPGWLTGILGLAEYVLLLVIALALGFGIPVWQATLFYAFVWVLAQTVRIAVLPLLFLTRLEDGGELRPVRWSVPPPARAAAGAGLRGRAPARAAHGRVEPPQRNRAGAARAQPDRAHPAGVSARSGTGQDEPFVIPSPPALPVRPTDGTLGRCPGRAGTAARPFEPEGSCPLTSRSRPR